jgi:hypothetical protein
MNRILAMVGIAIICWQYSTPRSAEGKPSYQSQNQTRNSQTPPCLPPPLVADLSAYGNQDQCQKEAPNKQRGLVEVSPSPFLVKTEESPWEKALVVATVLLVFVGAFQIRFLWKTVTATEENAKAARLSAEAVITSERAWLLVSKLEIVQFTKDEKTQTIHYWCRVACKNYGKTPAKLTAVKTVIQIGNNREVPDDFTIFEKQVQPYAPEVIPQEDPVPIIPRSRTVSLAEMEEIREQKKFLWLCGVVEYEDIFRYEPTHETRFCYLLEDRLDGLGRRWHMAGPPQFNGAT